MLRILLLTGLATASLPVKANCRCLPRPMGRALCPLRWWTLPMGPLLCTTMLGNCQHSTIARNCSVYLMKFNEEASRTSLYCVEGLPSVVRWGQFRSRLRSKVYFAGLTRRMRLSGRVAGTYSLAVRCSGEDTLIGGAKIAVAITASSVAVPCCRVCSNSHRPSRFLGNNGSNCDTERLMSHVSEPRNTGGCCGLARWFCPEDRSVFDSGKQYRTCKTRGSSCIDH